MTKNSFLTSQCLYDTKKFLPFSQMEYVDKQIEIEMTERKAREDLSAFKKQYNLYSPNSRGDGEGRGDGRDRGEGNRERGNGNRGARGGDRGRGGGGGGGGGGGAEGTGAWGHHDEDHRDSTNNGNRRDRDDRYGGRGGGGGGGNSKGAVSKEKSAGTSRSVKASDSGNAPSSESRSKNRGGASEAPLIAIPLPPTSHDEGGGSSNRQANRRGNKSKVEPVKIEEPEGAKSEGKRRRAGAATVDGAESSLANMSISSDSTGARAFEVAAAASAAKNAPKMEKKIVDRDSNDKDKADAADKASRKTRNTNSNGNGYGSAASKDAKADATPTTFTVVLNVDPRTTEGEIHFIIVASFQVLQHLFPFKHSTYPQLYVIPYYQLVSSSSLPLVPQVPVPPNRRKKGRLRVRRRNLSPSPLLLQPQLLPLHPLLLLLQHQLQL